MFNKRVCRCTDDCDCRAVFDDEQRNRGESDEWINELIADDNRQRATDLK